MLLLWSLLAVKRRYKRHTNTLKNIKTKFMWRIRTNLACMQEILVLLQQLKSSLLNIRNILLSEPQLTPGRACAMMVTGGYQDNWKTQLVRLWYAKKVKDIELGTRMASGVINRCQLISIAAGVVRTNNPNLLKEYGVI